jgi:hypothetical protein
MPGLTDSEVLTMEFDQWTHNFVCPSARIPNLIFPTIFLADSRLLLKSFCFCRFSGFSLSVADTLLLQDRFAQARRSVEENYLH